ncbi:OLC1v1024406C1 [Oldenlandia corymbosa var. corymbosa]|uniref:OLC1v1024406C1 n=1 Tax=Oldenlandia corymbosa var. corymbosa TaxID=529605 RepID=A0AAV1C4Q5_OLDCO|nr:OLC1v1024406C1 [Oldenlandia corymbosa var. corymbosa]
MSEEIAKTKVCCPCRVIEVNFSEKVLCVEQELQNLKEEHEGFSRSIFKEIESMQQDLIQRFIDANYRMDATKDSACVAKNWSVLYLHNPNGSEHTWYDFKETIYNRFWNSDIAYEIQTDLCELVQDDMDVESYIAKFEELCLNSDSNDLNEVLVVRFLNGLNSCYKDDVSLMKENDLYCAFQRVVLLELRVIDWVDNLIVAIDGGSSINCISEEFVRVNHLQVKYLSKPYKVRWLHGGMELSVTHSAKVDLRIGDLVSKLSPTPSSGNIEVEEELLSEDQGLEESNEDFANHWSDSSDEDSSDIQEVDACEFVPKIKRFEEIEDAHSSV